MRPFAGGPDRADAQSRAAGPRRTSEPAPWVLATDAEQRLRELGERGDIIKRMHKSLTKDGATRHRHPGHSEANDMVTRDRLSHRPRSR